MDVAEEQPCGYGVAKRMALPNGHRLCVVSASLLVTGGHHDVNVWAEAGGGETRAIVTLTPEKPFVAVPRVTLDGEFVLRHDSADATVQLFCQIIYDDEVEKDGGAAVDAPARLVEPTDIGTDIGGVELEPLDDDDYPEAELSDGDDGCRDDELDMVLLHVVDLGPPQRDCDGEFEFEPVVEYELPNEEDEAERNDSDNDEEDEDGGEEDEPPRKVREGEATVGSSRGSIPLVAAPAGTVVPGGDLLGPARFATVETTAGFMRLAAADAAAGQDEGREILVLYRYTRFSSTWSGRLGVEACRRTKLHWLRFGVAPAGDMASSLAWAGSSLGPMIYPALFRRQLQELWSSLSAPAMSTIPPRAARLQVIVDVGILRRMDHTPERMDHMCGALEAKMQEAWPDHYHVGMELRLPEPLPDDEEQGGDTRMAKRRKMVDDGEEDECSLCFYPLERGLAAWPGCRHVFHCECVEKTLEGSDMCPLCRNRLFAG